METFLLESIETVKIEIGRRRAEEERSAQQRSGRLPALGSAGRQSNLPNSADERVDIRELTWEDRERVLRLLFSKVRRRRCFVCAAAASLPASYFLLIVVVAQINNSAPFYPMPPHALAPDEAFSSSGGPPGAPPGVGEAAGEGMGMEGMDEFSGGDHAFFVTQPEVA